MRAVLSLTLGLLSVSTSSIAMAAQEQEAPPGEKEGSSGLEEIVVTATRREAKLQDVPVSVTAVTAETLGGAGVSQVRDLGQVAPGFISGRNVGANQPTIRGVGSSGVSPGDESNVATYVDGVYQADPFSTFIELVEIDRVEVLRGPQGTTFGRNATGGLVNVITPDPSFEMRGRIAGEYGRSRLKSNLFDVRGYITGGLTDAVAADLAVLYRSNDGYIKDLVRGGTLGDQKVFDVRSKLLWQPSDSAKLVLTGEYVEQKSTSNALQPYNNTNTRGLSYPGVILPTGPWQASTNIPPRLDFHSLKFALKTELNFDGFNVETTGAYQDSVTDYTTDSDSSNIFLGQIPIYGTAKNFSQEVRALSTSSGRFQWTAGVYAFYLKAGTSAQIITSNGLPGGPVSTLDLQPRITSRSFAGFAEGTYEIVPSLFVTVGARYTTEKKTFKQTVNGTTLAFGKTSRTFDKPTYRGIVRYQFAENANIYASYSTGFKSGVYNGSSTSPDPVNPEEIRSWEAGLKVEPLDWLRTNLSVFRYDYTDLQVQSRSPLANGNYILQNAGEARISGGEFELTASPLRGLQLNAAVSYNDGKYKNFPLAQTFVPLATGGNAAVTADVAGKRLIRSPEYTFSVGGAWKHEYSAGTARVNANLFHSARVYYDFANRFSQQPFTRVNGRDGVVAALPRRH
ncbi:TonB-dependent receptor [Sphingobium sp. JS3065]|uniref:TonB-dependent receptor n=1 Tax=Sphingobium sp. JS3065 TaxID=2970925 RepID=UPI0022653E0A|nr:TonB-dependent receptor [Sphingobium sp. JS3065]UZW55358.1 TonB-dependent receptor [Sphingobium sp. JS3065]